MRDTTKSSERAGRARGLSRRGFLGMAGGIPVAWMAARLAEGAAASGIPIALQLYSVRRDCQVNFDVALEQVAVMGFRAVEFAGYYTYAKRPADLRRRLDALGLKAASTHIGIETLQGDALTPTIEFHQAIGCRFLIVPGASAFTDSEKSKALADTFNKLADTLKPLDMACGYHNHVNEFRKDGDKTYWDLFAERTSRDVILQQDCGWTAAAGHDPVAYVRKYPRRTRTVHFKPTVLKGDTGKKPILGQDSVNWRAVYRACRSARTEWIVLEQETYPDGKTPMACTYESLLGLRKVID